jgi:hypothetical protein
MWGQSQAALDYKPHFGHLCNAKTYGCIVGARIAAIDFDTLQQRPEWVFGPMKACGKLALTNDNETKYNAAAMGF